MPEIRYIKLGEGGRYAKDCILGDRNSPDGSCIRLGYRTPDHPQIHELCLKNDEESWAIVQKHWEMVRLAAGANPRTVAGVARRDRNQICDFYSLPRETIWFTFYRGLLWWCNVETDVKVLGDHTRIRKTTIEGWRSTDPGGVPFRIELLDGRLTQKAFFKGTICGIGDRHDYLLRKIKGEQEPEVVAAKTTLATLHHHVNNLIRGLWWHDFETLVDLIFARAGWQRISVLGKNEEGYDMILASPVNARRVLVQVKSKATIDDLTEYLEFFGCAEKDGVKNYDEMYFVVHTPDKRLLSHQQGNVYVVGPDRLAELCINSGLVQWLIDKRS